MKYFFCFLTFWTIASAAYAEPDLSKISSVYDNYHKITIVYAREKLVTADMGIGASYSYSGHTMQQPPKTVFICLFGYHDDVQWQKLTALTLVYGGKKYDHKALCSLYGEDRDKSEDLVTTKYYESNLLEMPLATAKEVFSSDSVTITSAPEQINLVLTARQMDRCRELLAAIPAVSLTRPPDMKKAAPSQNGLPVTRTINEASSDATLATTGTMLTPRFSVRFLAFVTISGKQVRQPNAAILIAEMADDPILEKEPNITLNYGDTNLNLSSNVNKTVISDDGTKMAVRTYLIAYSRFMLICRAQNLSITVGDTTIPIPPGKMLGLREIARRIQH